MNEFIRGAAKLITKSEIVIGRLLGFFVITSIIYGGFIIFDMLVAILFFGMFGVDGTEFCNFVDAHKIWFVIYLTIIPTIFMTIITLERLKKFGK